MEKSYCHICGKECISDGCGTGYGIDKNNNKVCYSCCAEQDKKDMIQNKKTVLYLSKENDNKWYIVNWPSSLKIPVRNKRTGRHNIAGTQTTAYFCFNGFWWIGKQYGNFSDICYCKQLKETC
jgi:hypothetical protein